MYFVIPTEYKLNIYVIIIIEAEYIYVLLNLNYAIVLKNQIMLMNEIKLIFKPD